MPVTLGNTAPVPGVAIAAMNGADASIPDSCWIAGALTAIAAKSPGDLSRAIRRLPDGTLGLRYFRLHYPECDGDWARGTLQYAPQLLETQWRAEDLAAHGAYRFLEHGTFSLIPNTTGAQVSSVLCTLLGEKYKMVPASRHVMARIRAELLDPAARAFPVLGIRPGSDTGLTPKHAYVVRGDAKLDGDPALRLSDSVTGRTHVISDEDLLASLAGVALRAGSE